MNQNHFAKDLLFRQNTDAQELTCSVMDANWNKDDCCLGELDCFNNFPSFHNLSFDDMVAQKFVVKEEINLDFNFFDSVKDEEEFLLNQKSEDILSQEGCEGDNCILNLKPHNFKQCTRIRKESEDKTTNSDFLSKLY